MNKVDKIKSLIKEFQGKQDGLYSRYQAAEAAARQKYSEEGFRQEFMLGEWPQYAGKAQGEAGFTIRQVSYIFDEMREEFEAWMMKPLSANVVSVLNCISDFGLNLSIGELRIIEKSVRESYIGMKVFAGLAARNGYIVEIPTADKYLKALENAKSDTKLAIEAYAGEGPSYPGRDLLGRWTWQGVDHGDHPELHLYTASDFLHDGGTLDRLAALWDSANAPLQYTLNQDETEKAKKSIRNITDKNGQVDAKAANKLLEQDPDFANKLKSMPKKEMEKFPAVSKYFHLDNEEKGTVKESAISPSMENVSQFTTGRGEKINADTLNQFK